MLKFSVLRYNTNNITCYHFSINILYNNFYLFSLPLQIILLINMDGLLARLSEMDINRKISKIPSKENLVQFPPILRNDVLRIQSTPMRDEQLATIIIATISMGYTEEMFEEDVSRICSAFKLDKDDKNQVQKIALQPIMGNYNSQRERNDRRVKKFKEASNNPKTKVEELKKALDEAFSNSNNKDSEEVNDDDLKKVLDSQDATEKITKAVQYINKGKRIMSSLGPSGPTVLAQTSFGAEQGIDQATQSLPGMYWLRIVSVGIGYTDFGFKALEFLLNEWNAPKGERCIQFIIKNDTISRRYINFWESACIKKLCKWVDYVNLSEYLPFGYYKGECNIWETNAVKL